MLIDRRRDHSIRIPRPDLSATLGAPNACGNCHVNRTPQWAADYVAKWYGGARIGFQQFGPALQAGRLGAPGAQRALAELMSNPGQPAIARATALAMLAAFNEVSNVSLDRNSQDASPLVRRAAAEALSTVAPAASASTMLRLLNDPVRAVRIEAAVSLDEGATRGSLPDDVTHVLDHDSAEYLSTQTFNTDRPEGHLNLGLFFAKKGMFARAETELKTALSIDPSFSPAAVNLADLDRELGRDDEAEVVLRRALLHTPDDASLLYALGLLNVRKKRTARALDLFAAAARLDPSNPRYAYVYAIALNDAGDTKAAINILEGSIRLHPYDRDSLAALVSFCDRTGDQAKARRYTRVLDELTTN
ncbi:MAG: tetratricopeptide repeat protein [Candidatus Binataceae bacterium]